jgi:hypothetical protein
MIVFCFLFFGFWVSFAVVVFVFGRVFEGTRSDLIELTVSSDVSLVAYLITTNNNQSEAYFTVSCCWLHRLMAS